MINAKNYEFRLKRMEKKMIIKRRAMGYLLIPLCYLLLSACGGGSGGDTAAPTTTPTTTPTTPTALTGKLIPEIRQNGLSLLTVQDAVYKAALDETIEIMRTVIVDMTARFPANIPVFFSGCGQANAFYASAGVGSLHAGLQQVNKPNIVDVAAVFGPDRAAPAMVFCHEMSEASLQHFKLKVFPEDTDNDRDLAKFAAAVFDISILFHEVGHALLGEHQSRIVDFSAMQNELIFLIKNTCKQTEPNCNTFNEDFADWISAYAFSLALNDQAAKDPNVAKLLLGGFLVGVGSWEDILGAGGDAAHGFTTGRQANIMCYVYGGVKTLRDLDNSDNGGDLALAMAQLGILSPVDACQGSFAANKAATIKHLGFAFPD